MPTLKAHVLRRARGRASPGSGVGLQAPSRETEGYSSRVSSVGIAPPRPAPLRPLLSGTEKE